MHVRDKIRMYLAAVFFLHVDFGIILDQPTWLAGMRQLSVRYRSRPAEKIQAVFLQEPYKACDIAFGLCCSGKVCFSFSRFVPAPWYIGADRIKARFLSLYYPVFPLAARDPEIMD